MSPTFTSWDAMIMRCYCPSNIGYKQYGARGITVHPPWTSAHNPGKGFSTFLADMGERPSRQHSLDRIENDGNYEPKNCRWATVDEQNSNKRNSVLYDFEGERLILRRIAERVGLPYDTLRWRICKFGMPFDVAISLPLQKGKPFKR